MKKKIFFFVLNKYQSVTHVSNSIFIGLFKNVVFKSVALVTKKVVVYFRFCFHRPDYFFALTYPKNFKIYFFNKTSIKLLFIKSLKFPRISVKNESAREKKLKGGAPNTPSRELLRVSFHIDWDFMLLMYSSHV